MDESAIDALCKRLRKHGASGFLIGDEARDALLDIRAKLAAAERERDAVRELMNVYNLGGWTDAVGPMQRALTAERALADMTADRDRLLQRINSFDANTLATFELVADRDSWQQQASDRVQDVLDMAAQRDAAMLVVAAAHAWQGEPSAEGGLTHCESNLVRALGNFATWQRAAIAASEKRGEGA